jgi:hypothetical protein
MISLSDCLPIPIGSKPRLHVGICRQTVAEGGNMGPLLWVVVALAVVCISWISYEVVRLLKDIAAELRQIRTYLQGVSGEIEKISGPLNYVQKIYGLGESVLRRNQDK